jgi:hypothetical protein
LSLPGALSLHPSDGVLAASCQSVRLPKDEALDWRMLKMDPRRFLVISKILPEAVIKLSLKLHCFFRRSPAIEPRPSFQWNSNG